MVCPKTAKVIPASARQITGTRQRGVGGGGACLLDNEGFFVGAVITRNFIHQSVVNVKKRGNRVVSWPETKSRVAFGGEDVPQGVQEGGGLIGFAQEHFGGHPHGRGDMVGGPGAA